LNDAPKQIQCSDPDVTVVNVEERYENLGYKRQALLEMVDAPYIAHWDDDDIYLPWHLQMCFEQLKATHKGCVKPKQAWMIAGSKPPFRFNGLKENVFEAMIVYDTEEGKGLGGYTPDASGQSVRMMNRFSDHNNFHKFPPYPAASFIFRWGDGHYHNQSGGNGKSAAEKFAKKNTDFGNGELTPGSIDHVVDCLAHEGQDVVEDPVKFMSALAPVYPR
jgi:hypothetical protein